MQTLKVSFRKRLKSPIHHSPSFLLPPRSQSLPPFFISISSKSFASNFASPLHFFKITFFRLTFSELFESIHSWAYGVKFWICFEVLKTKQKRFKHSKISCWTLEKCSFRNLCFLWQIWCYVPNVWLIWISEWKQMRTTVIL